MLTVWKYPLYTEDYFSLSLPSGSEILTVQMQHGSPQIWALVNPDNQEEERKFRLAGTGHNIEHAKEDMKYIGTFQLYDGDLIFHLFEMIPL